LCRMIQASLGWGEFDSVELGFKMVNQYYSAGTSRAVSMTSESLFYL
jgi:hypothetical protein